MNCREARERMTDLFDACAQTTPDLPLREHLEACPVCSVNLAELRQALEALPTARVAASSGFTEAVMSSIQDAEPARKRRSFSPWRIGLAAAAALVVCAGASFSVWYVNTGGKQPVGAFKLLGDAAHAMARVQAVHIQAQMRTLPRDNFELIVLDQEFVPVELWANLEEPFRWRIEKPGRVVVMDGDGSTLLIKPNMVANGSVNSGFVGWMTSLLDAEDLLYNETALATEEGSQISMTVETTPEGVVEDVLQVEAKAKGTYVNDWLRNSSITDSDNLRVYRFEPETKLLKGIEIYVHAPQGDVLVFQTLEVSYDLPLDNTLFALEVPKDAITLGETPMLSDNAKYEKMSPREMAQNFFDACAREDWDEMLKYWSVSAVDDRIMNYLGGLEVVELGAPFQSGVYPGWFVPYEIRV
ncbi:MAG: hypothetical protein WC655_00825, partial [Candidatus Hydrogenedentales bacterium]